MTAGQLPARGDLEQAVMVAVWRRAAELTRNGPPSLDAAYTALLTAAEPSDAGDLEAGPRFVDALVALAANCVMRLVDEALTPHDLQDVIAQWRAWRVDNNLGAGGT